MSKVVSETTQIPLHLRELAPLLVLQRVTILDSRWATTLTLEDVEALVVRLYNLAESDDALTCIVRILEVYVERYAIENIELLALLQDVEHLCG